MNILFTNIGRRVALVKHFREVFKELSIKGKLVGADLSFTAPAIHIVDKKYQICPISSVNYIPELRNICVNENIDVLISLLDTDLFILAENKKEFEEIGTKVLISSKEVVDICRDKVKTYKFLKTNCIDTPKLVKYEEVLSGENNFFPLILKPSKGSASKGVKKINNLDELNFHYYKIEDPILQEYVTGTEYTVDVLVDLEGKIRCIVPRERLEVRAGEVSKGVTVKDQRIIIVVQKCIDALKGALGPITVQGFLNNEGKYKITEINPRFGGGHPLSIAAGADFPRWIIEFFLGTNPKIKIDGWNEGVVMLRYDDAIFVNIDNIENLLNCN